MTSVLRAYELLQGHNVRYKIRDVSKARRREKLGAIWDTPEDDTKSYFVEMEEV